MSIIKINYKGKELQKEKGVLLSDIKNEVKDDYEYDVIAASVNNRLTSLDSKLTKSCTVDFFDITTANGIKT